MYWKGVRLRGCVEGWPAGAAAIGLQTKNSLTREPCWAGWESSDLGVRVLLCEVSSSRQRRADRAGLRHSPVLGEESAGLLMTIPADRLYWGRENS